MEQRINSEGEIKVLLKPMNNPLGVSPSKGKQGTTRGKEKIFLTSVGIEPTTSGIDLPSLCRLSYKVAQRKSGTIHSVLKMLPSACGLGQHFQDLGHSFSLYGPPSRQITYIYKTRLFLNINDRFPPPTDTSKANRKNTREAVSNLIFCEWA